MADISAPQPRRPKRSSAAISPVKPTSTATPSRDRPKKKARFSEPILSHDTTGLTPAIGKANLKTPRRRVSTPAVTRYQDHDEVQFTPLRQQLSARTQRQIRRIGLSDAQNQFYADQKSQFQLRRQLEQKNKELQILKDELEESKRREASLLQAEDASSQQRIDELEAEVQELTQRSFQETSDYRGGSPSFHDDGGFQIYEDSSATDENQPIADDDDDVTVDLELETARQAKETMFRSSQSFSNNVVHFEDSPVKSARSFPPPPAMSAEALSKELNAAINRAEEAEVALAAMTTEIKSLGFPCTNNDDATQCISTIKSHFHHMRTELERTMPGETTISFTFSALMPEMLHKLRLAASQIRNREAELRSMHDQQRSLKGNFDHALTATGRANARIKELEDTLDKNAEEMLEQRMRAQAMEREAKEHEKNNQSLITAIEKYRQEVTRLEQLVELIEAEQAARLQDVRTATTAQFTQQISDMDAKVAAETRGRRAAEESAIERLRKINELETVLSKARQQSSDVEEQLHSLETELSFTATSHSSEIGALNSRVSNLSNALSMANAKVDSLTRDIRRVETLYRDEVARGREFADTNHRLLLQAAAQSAESKKSYVRASKVKLANWELESDDLPSDPIIGGEPMTPSSMVRFSEFSEVDDNDGDYLSRRDREESSSAVEDNCDDNDDHVEGRVELSRGSRRHRRRSSVILPASSPFLGRGILKKGAMKPRRRYDSGIGMDSPSEAEDGDDANDSGVATPQLSSEADVDVDIDVMV